MPNFKEYQRKLIDLNYDGQEEDAPLENDEPHIESKDKRRRIVWECLLI